jgi:uncharacterized protein (DUF111 family)
MSKFARIRTTIPPRTYGAGKKAATPAAILLRMSFLELERQRRVQETELLSARAIKLQSRIEEIDREKLVLRQALDQTVEPLASSGALPITRSAVRPSNQVRPRGGFAIRY